MGGKKNISMMGYKRNSPDRNNPFNVIQSGRITMQDVPHPVLGIDNLGNVQMMTPGGEYMFPGNSVFEVPIRMQEGGDKQTTPQKQDPILFWNKWIQENPPGSEKNPGDGITVGEWMEERGFGDIFTGKCEGPPGECPEEKIFMKSGGMMQYGYGGIPCMECGGTHKMAIGGPIPSVNQGEIIYPFTPSMAFGGNYNFAKTFKKMAKKQFGGNMELQNYDTDTIVDERIGTMKNYLSNNAMMALALEEAGQLGNQMNQFMQFGGNFGYNPNMYNRNNFAMAGMNQLPGAFGNFMGSAYGAFSSADPYWKLKVKQQGGAVTGTTGGSEGTDWSAYFSTQGDPGTVNTDGSVNMGNGIRWLPDNTYVDAQGNTVNYDPETSTVDGVPVTDDPQANMEYLKNKYQNEGITDEFGNVYSAADLNSNTGGGNSGGSGGSGGGNQGGGYSGGSNIVQEQPYTVPGYQGPRTGNYTGSTTPVNTQPSYVPGSQNQYGVFNTQGGGYGGYGLFPMNIGKGRYNFANIPDITYDPSKVFLKDYQYKGRLFGPGARKIKMTFSPFDGAGGAGGMGMDGSQPMYGNQMGQSYAGPNQTMDAYIEKNMDPTLYSKMLHGDASDEEIADFNRQYKQLESDYYGDRSRQATSPITPETKTPFGTKVKNFFQERRAEGDRKARDKQAKKEQRRYERRAGDFESAVHPDYNPILGNMTEQYQYGGLAGAYPHRDLGVNFSMGIPMYQNGGLVGYYPRRDIAVNFNNGLPMMQNGGLAGWYPRRNLGMNTTFNLPYMQVGGSAGFNEAYDNPNAVNGEDTTLIWKRKMGINPEEAVAWGISGLDMVSSLREAQDRAKNEEIYKQRMMSDALFQPIDAGSASRGDYDPNSGMFRPHMQVPVQFTGANFGQIGSPASIYQQGGEYYLDDEQIELIKRMGGSIEYLD